MYTTQIDAVGTRAGKDKVSRNALKNGLLSQLKVLPTFERQEDWQAHLDSTVSELRPEGHIEEVLAERIALLMWRLSRVARYEQEATTVGIMSAEMEWGREELGRGPEEISVYSPLLLKSSYLRFAKRWLRFLMFEIYTPPSDSDETEFLAPVIIHQAAVIAKVDISERGFLGIDVPDESDKVGLANFNWSRAEVLQAVEAIAWAAKIELEGLLAMMRRYTQDLVDETREQLLALRGHVLWEQRKRMILDGPGVQKICRYETHLERSLYKAMHELQRLQAARKGRQVSVPTVLDVTVA